MKKGRKFSKWEENTVEKGEIARYEQFLLFTMCFQKTHTADMLKPGIVWERIKGASILFYKLSITTNDTIKPVRDHLY